MNSISSQPLMTGPAHRQNTLPDSQFASYVRKQSVSAYESLDAGLTIKTKEGDLVTLTSNSYTRFNAAMYDSKGVLQTASGRAMVTQNHREITLTSGESFSFSVVGDLSEEELWDIEAIVKGIDGIISEMVKGDMDDAVAKALSMGGYDSVSMYTADITYQRSYAMRSETQAEMITPLPDTEIQAESVKAVPEAKLPMLSKEENSIFSELRPFPENHRPRRKRNNTIKNIDQFVERIAKKLEKLENKLLDKVQEPINKLFNYYLENDGVKKNKGKKRSTYNLIDNTKKQVDKLIDQMVGKIFKDSFFKIK